MSLCDSLMNVFIFIFVANANALKLSCELLKSFVSGHMFIHHWFWYLS